MESECWNYLEYYHLQWHILERNQDYIARECTQKGGSLCRSFTEEYYFTSINNTIGLEKNEIMAELVISSMAIEEAQGLVIELKFEAHFFLLRFGI